MNTIVEAVDNSSKNDGDPHQLTFLMQIMHILYETIFVSWDMNTDR